MNDKIPQNIRILEEALTISEELLKNIELNEIPLSNCALKACRLARLLNDNNFQKLFEYEVSGYLKTPGGITPELYQLALLANRHVYTEDTNAKAHIFIESIEQIESIIETSKLRLSAAKDRDVSISSANPEQILYAPPSNLLERTSIIQSISTSTERLSSRRKLIYSYCLKKNHELKFSGIVSDAFSRIRNLVDSNIAKHIPESIEMISSIYGNLSSDNPEDWSNAVHSCRRIIIELANSLFPPQTENREKVISGKKVSIKLGEGNYINRIICYVEDNTDSEKFVEIFGSHMEFLGNRLDAIVSAVQKGTHDKILSKEEADRYVVHTYMIIGDILSLSDGK